MVRAVVLLLGLVVAVCAQSTNENGPIFNPSEAPFFGPSGLVDPTVDPIPTLTDNVPTFTQTPTFIRSRTSSGLSHSISSTASASSHMSSHAASSSMSRSLTSILATSSTASTSAPPQSSAAAVGNGQNMVGMIAGGVFAGLALL